MQKDIQKLKALMDKAREHGIDDDTTVVVVLREVVDLCIATIGAAQTRDILARMYGRVAFLATEDPGARN